MDAIGVFDSGVGGFTVVSALRRRLPHESILYLGDTARLPYGSARRLVRVDCPVLVSVSIVLPAAFPDRSQTSRPAHRRPTGPSPS